MVEAPVGSRRAKVLGLIALLSIAVVARLALREDSTAGPEQLPDSVHAETLPAEAAEVAGEPTRAAPTPASSAHTERNAAPVRSAGPGEFLVRGRCIGEDGLPLPDCVAVLIRSVAPNESGRAWQEQHPKAEPPAPLRVDTRSDGSFAIAMDANPAFVVFFRAVRYDVVPAHAELKSPPAGSDVDLGDVLLWHGVKVNGSIHFDDGTPCADRRVILQDHAPSHAPLRGSLAAVPHVYVETRTRADGTFEFGDLVRPCTWNLDARDAGTHPWPYEVKTDLSRPIETIALVLETPDLVRAITGRVEDEKGRPVAGATVQAAPVGRSFAARTGKSADDGTFTLAPLRSTGGGPVRLTATLEGRSSDEASSGIAWGARGVVLVLRNGLVGTLRVTDEDGVPIEDYDLTTGLARYSPGSAAARGTIAPPTLRGPHADGRCALPKSLGYQRTLLLSFPAGADRAPRILVLRAEDAVDEQFDVVAPRGADLEIRLVDGSGAAVVGSTIECYDLQGDSLETKGATAPLAPPGLPFAQAPQVTKALRLLVATTDGTGVARVRVPTDVGIGVSALGPGHVPLAFDLGQVAAGAQRTLVVRRGAGLTGRVGPKEMLDAARSKAGVTPFAEWPQNLRLRIELVPAGTIVPESFPGSPSTAAAKAVIEVAADGSFAGSGLEAGSFDAYLRSSPATNALGSQPIHHPIGSVHLVDSSSRELVADVPMAMPARGTFRMLCNGEPMIHTALLVLSSPPTRCQTDATGVFPLHATAGSYPVLVLMEPTGRCAQMISDAPLELAPRTAGDPVDVDCRATKVRLRVVDEKGQPVAGRALRSRLPGGPDRAMSIADTDANGTVERMLRVGAHDLEVRILRAPTEAEIAAERTRIAEQTASQPAGRPGQGPMSPGLLEGLARSLANQRLLDSAPWVYLGSIVVESGAAAEFDLLLPTR